MMDQDVDVSDIKATGNDTYKIATYSSNANISTDNNNGDKNTNDVMSESSAVNIQMMNQDVDVSDIKATGNDTYKIATYSSNANISTDNNNGDKNTNDVMSESSAVNIQMMDQDVDVSDIKATGNDTYKIATYSSNVNISTDNDGLLARALSELENENIDKKPVGRSYRKTKGIKTSLSCDAHFKAIDPNPGPRSSQSSSTENILFCDDTSSVAFVPKKQKISSPLPILSDSSDEDVSEVRMDFIEFTNKKKDIILSLISDDYNSEAQFRSERVFAVRNLPSLKNSRQMLSEN